ncbi:MAG: signal peptidase II [Patescibacteria group bacterium]
MRLLKNKYFLSAVIFFAFILDRLFKWLVLNREGFFAVKNILKINYYPNQGLALSFPVASYLLYPLIILIIIIVFYFLIISLKRSNYFFLWSFGLIFVGAVSNLIDRVRFGHVVDYVNFLGWFPVFNISDAMIVLGVGLIFIKSFGRNNLTDILK